MLYCPNCGNEIPPNNNRCPNCGATLKESISQEQKPPIELPQVRNPPVFEKSTKNRIPFWFGILGGILGILGIFWVGLSVIFGIFARTYSSSTAETLLLGVILVIIFSLIGIIGAFIENTKIGGGLMILSSILLLLSSTFFRIIAFALLLIGGIIKIKK